ncbi:MAG: protein-glutamate methylesterase/protein-glutamine glutaminase [Halanaerobiales bacterium]
MILFMIKVLVVDDSAFMRQIFKKTINQQPDLKVIETARNGSEAIKLLAEINPDVITLDVEMPVKNGIQTLKEIITSSESIPVIMVSAMDSRETVIKALDLGAFDFIPKPSGTISLDIDTIKNKLISKIKAAASSRNNSPDIKNIKTKYTKKVNPSKNFPVIAIGTSSGGPKALKQLLSAFPGNFPAGFIVVQHMPAGFTASLARNLNQKCNLKIKEAEKNNQIEKGKVLIAPGNYHLEISKQKKVVLNQRPPKWGVRPCVDYMMKSVARVFQKRTIGIILTGMGHDGGEGMKEIKKYNGYGIVEDESTALVYGMPSTTIKKNAYDKILPLDQIPPEIIKLIERRY